MFKKLYQDPLVLFLFIGALVFAFYNAIVLQAKMPVVLNEDNRQLFVEQYELLLGREVTTSEVKKIENDYILEEVLFREAIEAGMHLTDPEIRSKLIEEMRYQITGILPEPEEAKLVQYYLSNIKRYEIEASISFQHVYYTNEPDAEILKQLESGETVSDDEFWQGRMLPDYGLSMIRGMFGKSFLDSLLNTKLNQWVGPIKSMLGWHFVKVLSHQPIMPLTFEQSKVQVINDYTVDIIEVSIENYVEDLNGKYEIIRNVE
jgi:parvulin-like peptidyl-prolyl isomerase